MIGARRDKPPRPIGQLPTERIVPLPPGFVLTWISTSWIPKGQLHANWDAIDVNRLLGYEATDRIWAAIFEDPTIARLTRPEDYGEPESDWAPVLIEDRQPGTPQRNRLATYFCTEEEVKTTLFLQRELGFRTNDAATTEVLRRDGTVSNRFVLTERLLKAIPEMSPSERRRLIPRIGLCDADTWNSARADVSHNIRAHALSTVFEKDVIVYMVPFRNCTQFYCTDRSDEWMASVNQYADEVGFDFAPQAAPEDRAKRSLWSAVFGDALIPEDAPRKEQPA